MNFLKTFRQADGEKASQQPASQPQPKTTPQDNAQHQYYEVDDPYDSQVEPRYVHIGSWH